MKKLKIKKITVFSSIVILLGGITACSDPRSMKEFETDHVEEKSQSETTPKIEETSPNNNEIEENVYDTKESFDSESTLLNFIQSGTVKLKEISQSETTQHVKDTLIHSGLALSDFVLLDKPIGGMKLSQLTNKGKEVVISSLFAVDGFVKEKVPEQYETLKNKIVQIKNKFKEIIIDTVGEENYEYFGKLKDKAIDKAQEYWKHIKEYGETGKQKYKNWREK